MSVQEYPRIRLANLWKYYVFRQKIKLSTSRIWLNLVNKPIATHQFIKNAALESRHVRGVQHADAVTTAALWARSNDCLSATFGHAAAGFLVQQYSDYTSPRNTSSMKSSVKPTHTVMLSCSLVQGIPEKLMVIHLVDKFPPMWTSWIHKPSSIHLLLHPPTNFFQ
jgi:hypothetical protein